MSECKVENAGKSVAQMEFMPMRESSAHRMAQGNFEPECTLGSTGLKHSLRSASAEL